MNLSLYTGGVKPYLEYGWVCAPNTAGQSIAANTITTLTIDTEVADTGGFGSIASNQITLAAGTYYFKASTSAQYTDNSNYPSGGFALYNITTSTFITRRPRIWMMTYSGNFELEGQFTISASTVLDLRLWTNLGGFLIASGNYNALPPIATAGADQRTTIKLWKLA